MRARLRISAAIAAVGLVLVSVPAAQASPSPVVPIVVPGSTTPVWGSINGLPPMTQAPTTLYEAGPALGPYIELYRATGQYQRDQAAVARAAQRYLDRWLRDSCTSARDCGGRRPAIVFDIDDTLLDWYPVYQSTQFTYDVPVVAAAKENCQTPAIVPTRSLYRWAQRHKVAVFLITGRSVTEKPWTTACLEQQGMSGWDGLTMRQPSEASLAASVYKSRARAAIEAQGYRIAISVGDQLSDMMYGHAAAGFRLPNPMYYIP